MVIRAFPKKANFCREKETSIFRTLKWNGERNQKMSQFRNSGNDISNFRENKVKWNMRSVENVECGKCGVWKIKVYKTDS